MKFTYIARTGLQPYDAEGLDEYLASDEPPASLDAVRGAELMHVFKAVNEAALRIDRSGAAVVELPCQIGVGWCSVEVSADGVDEFVTLMQPLIDSLGLVSGIANEWLEITWFDGSEPPDWRERLRIGDSMRETSPSILASSLPATEELQQIMFGPDDVLLELSTRTFVSYGEINYRLGHDQPWVRHEQLSEMSTLVGLLGREVSSVSLEQDGTLRMTLAEGGELTASATREVPSVQFEDEDVD